MSYGTLTYRHFLLTAGRPSESSFPASNSIGEDERAPEDDWNLTIIKTTTSPSNTPRNKYVSLKFLHYGTIYALLNQYLEDLDVKSDEPNPRSPVLNRHDTIFSRKLMY